MNKGHRAAEFAARDSYGKLLAILARRSGDIHTAEDVLADAFAKALSTWPHGGVPDNPDAWLLTVARNGLTDLQRRRTRFPETTEIPETTTDDPARSSQVDQRLALMLACTHEAIAHDLHAPLILQTVLGVTVADIARLFLQSPTALAQRLVRAKAKIRAAGIPFNVPDESDLPARLEPICEAIYAAHAADWLVPADALGQEAFYLADLLRGLRPEDPEVLGLAALIAFGHARADARLDDGVFVPIDEQDVTRWDGGLIAYGINVLDRAYQQGAPGRFQIEAAIQSVHLDRRRTGATDWRALHELYQALSVLHSTAGSDVAHAVVVARISGPEACLARLQEIDRALDRAFQPLWAARADCYRRLGDRDAAATAYDKAISLTTEMPVRRFLERRRHEFIG